jgi:hypothetical protein
MHPSLYFKHLLLFPVVKSFEYETNLLQVFFTGGSLNPARSFGPDVILHTFSTYHWIYWVGPILGSLLASGFYKFIKMLEYETVNPGADHDHDHHDVEAQTFDKKDTNLENTVQDLPNGDNGHLGNNLRSPTAGSKSDTAYPTAGGVSGAQMDGTVPVDDPANITGWKERSNESTRV